MDLYTSVLNEKLERLDEEAQKVSTDTVVNTLTSCHGKATSLHGDKLGSQPMSEEELRTLEDDCNALESTFYDLLRQLKLFDVQEVLALYKNLVDVLVQRDEDHYKCPSKMMISSTFESCDDLKDDVMKYYHSDYNKNVMESNLIGCHDLPFDDNSRYVDINNALRKTEALFSQASHLREVLVQELAENVRLLKPVEINHNKGKHRRKSVDGSPANDGNSTILDDSKSPSPSLAPISPSSALQQIKRSISGGVNDDSLKVRTSAIQDLSSQSVVNGRAHATDLLRSFISELRTIGLAVHSVERKLGTIQRDRQSCTSESLYKSNQPTKDMDVLGNDSRVSTSPHVLSRDSSNKIIDFESIGLHLDKLLKKPIGRSAVQLITDTMKKIKASVNAFDDEWVKSHCSVMDYYHHNWIEMSSLQSKLSEKSIVDDLEKIPVLADLISNPFGSCPLANNDNCDWDWLTALPPDLNSTEKICRKMNVNKNDNVGDLTQILSFLEESCSHPFISPMSVMDKKVSMKNCLTPRLMSELASDINMEVSDNMKRLDAPFLLKSGDSSSNPQCLQESPLFKALQPTDRKNIFNTDFDFVKQRQVLFGEHITNLKTGKYFNETVDRALYILGLGLNAVVVDGCTRSVADRLSEERCKISIKAVADGSPNGVGDKHFIADNFHRAKLLFTIIKRLGEKPADIVGDGDMSDVRPARVGPILIVCRANELLDFHDILQQECDKSIGSDSTFRFLPYFGDSMDREILRSYMLPENLYTERSHCHIVLTNYEAFTQDFVHFKKINWYLMVLDMYWGILSNVAYKKVVSEFSTLNCRHRIVSCPSLGNSNRNEKHSTTSGNRQSAHIQTALKPVVKYPDITSTLNFLLPAFANLLDSQEQPYGKVVDDEFVMNVHNRRFCLHLLASMTVAYEECLELLICDQAEDVNSAMYQQNLKLFQDASELMPYYYWDCVSLQVSESGEQCSQEPSLSETQGVSISKKKIVFHFDYYGKYTRHYIDPKIDAELKNVKLESVGNLDPSLRKRSRKRPGIKSGSIGPPPLKESKSSKEGGGTTVAVGEGIIGVGVIKGKRPYNMAKRRAIQQGLLPSKRKKSGSVASVVRDVMNEILIKIVANSNEGPELLDIEVKKEILGGKGSVNVKEEFSAVDIKGEGNDTATTALGKDTIENENGETSPALVNLKRSFSNDSDSSMQEPGKYNLPNAKKPKLSYYQRKKEAEYEKALATGIYPQKLLKRQPKKSFDTNGVYIPLKLKVTAMKKFCKKDERDRSISCRGNRVQVVVNFPGRHRFLGSFKNLEEAEEAYNAALAQRDVLTTTVCFVNSQNYNIP